jgi:hypothetical protein
MFFINFSSLTYSFKSSPHIRVNVPFLKNHLYPPTATVVDCLDTVILYNLHYRNNTNSSLFEYRLDRSMAPAAAGMNFQIIPPDAKLRPRPLAAASSRKASSRIRQKIKGSRPVISFQMAM